MTSDKYHLYSKNRGDVIMLSLMYELSTFIFAVTVIVVLMNKDTFNIEVPDGLSILIIILCINNITMVLHKLRKRNIL